MPTDPDPNAPDPKQGDPGTGDPKTYSESYVQALKRESITARKEAEALAAERDELKAFRDAREKEELEKKGEYDKALAKIESERKAEAKKYGDELAARDKRYIVAEAKAEALKAGIIDPADVASVDFGELKIGEDGTIAGLAEKIAALKTAKPHWFKPEGGGGQQQGTQQRAGASAGTGGTNKTDGNAVDFMKLTDEQMQTKLNEILRV